MYTPRFLTSTLLALYFFTLAADPLVVHLDPPYTDESDFVVQTSCDRPRRPEGVNISLEPKDGKIIVHCYGHGGFGFTTLFGSIQESLKLLCAQNPDIHTPIRIIGSGCMGLTMAIELHRHGFTHITISTKERYNLPSWRAGGFFDPGTGRESDPKDIYNVQLGLATYHVLQMIEHNRHPYLTADVVRQLPIYYPADLWCGVEVLEKLNVVPASELVTINFGNGVIHEGYKRQMTYFIDVSALMKQLWATIEQYNIPVVDEEVIAFGDCTESIICNCTGLGSRTLNKDSVLNPARGHFFMLRPNANAKLDYMFFTRVKRGDRKDYIYFFPKPSFVTANSQIETAGLLGGTFIPYTTMTEAESRALDDVEFARLTERSRMFFHGK